MSLEPSELSLPQIAAAVAAGELPLADAEAELKRRPAADASRWKRFAPSPPTSRPPGAAEILTALGDTRRELLRATRQLSLLASRLDALERLAAPMQPAVAPAAAPPSHPQRKLRLERTPVSAISLPTSPSGPSRPSRTEAA